MPQESMIKNKNSGFQLEQELNRSCLLLVLPTGVNSWARELTENVGLEILSSMYEAQTSPLELLASHGKHESSFGLFIFMYVFSFFSQVHNQKHLKSFLGIRKAL